MSQKHLSKTTDSLWTPLSREDTSSPRVLSSEPLEGISLQGRPLLILMHGYGDNELLFYEMLSPWLRSLGETTVLVSLRAPISLGDFDPENGQGYGWFLFEDQSCPPPQGLRRSAEEIYAWAKELKAKTGASSIGLLGFSQGGALTVDLQRVAPGFFDYSVNFSGFILDPSPDNLEAERDVALGGSWVRERRLPEVFWALGEDDDVLPQQIWDQSRRWLLENTTPELHSYRNLDHRITPEVLQDALRFITRHIDQGRARRRPIDLQAPALSSPLWVAEGDKSDGMALGARDAPNNAPNLEDQDLVILLHGWGAHENHLAQMVPTAARVLPEWAGEGLPRKDRRVYVSLRAPFPEAMGYAWFSRETGPTLEAANLAADAVAAWLKQTVEHHGRPRRIGLLGFSQGGALAVQLLLRYPELFNFGIGICAFIADHSAAAEPKPVLWIQGGADTVLGATRITDAENWLPDNTQLTRKSFPKLGHELNSGVVAAAADYISQQLK